MTLYDDLGVSKDATPEEIQAAYRKRAKATHPDKPDGDAEAFKRVNHANIILSDPDSREQYDRSGKEQTTSPEDFEQAMAMEMIGKQFMHVLTMAEFDLTRHDPLKSVLKLTRMHRDDAKKELLEANALVTKLRRTVKRLRKKGKEAKATRLEGIMAGLERELVKQVNKCERTIRVCKKVKEILTEHDYELDGPTAEETAAMQAMAALRHKLLSGLGMPGPTKGAG